MPVDEDQWTAASRRQQQLNDLTAWGRRIGALGIDGSRMVVVYDDGELKFASRVRYLLAHFGVKTMRGQVLNWHKLGLT